MAKERKTMPELSQETIRPTQDVPQSASQIRFVATPSALIRAGEAALVKIKERQSQYCGRFQPLERQVTI